VNLAAITVIVPGDRRYGIYRATVTSVGTRPTNLLNASSTDGNRETSELGDNEFGTGLQLDISSKLTVL
jgi:hypothetical protein